MVPYLLEKGGGIFHIGRQIMNVPGSQELSMDKFLDDIFKSKRKYSYALLWELKDLPLIKKQLVHQITKSDWML